MRVEITRVSMSLYDTVQVVMLIYKRYACRILIYNPSGYGSFGTLFGCIDDTGIPSYCEL